MPKRGGYLKDSRAKEESIRRTIERYEGTVSLIKAWTAVSHYDYEYLRELRMKAHKLKANLREKGVLVDEIIEREKGLIER